MPSRFPLFDRSRLRLSPLSERQHGLSLESIGPLAAAERVDPALKQAALAIAWARRQEAPVILMMGAHLIRAGVQRYIIDLLERGLVTGLAGNGACAIHDFELATIGATTESVARYISEGRFGLWRELEELAEAYNRGAARGWGAGECVGELIERRGRYRDLSLFYAARRLGRPFTVHMGIGHDILHELPNCDGAALGRVSYTDFLIFARELENLGHGVFANFGSAVTGPEVFLKALAMARNVSPDGGPRHFSTLVADLHGLPADTRTEAAADQPLYYFRPWKTLLSRTVRDGGQSWYVRLRHEQSLPQLWTALNEIGL